MTRALRSSVVGAAVDAYDRHVGRYGPELAREMVRVSGVRAGQRALDVGCGTGALTIALAEVLGEESVAGIDPSERFVEACGARVPSADLRVGTGEELPWGDDEFDVVLAQLVVDGMNDARHGAAEMRRVARPGGVLPASIWDFEGGMTLLRAVWDSALEVDAELARSFGAEKRNPFSRPHELEELWRTHRTRAGRAGPTRGRCRLRRLRRPLVPVRERRRQPGPLPRGARRAAARALQAWRGRAARIAVRPLPPDGDGLVCARDSAGRIAARPRARAARFRRVASARDGTLRAPLRTRTDRGPTDRTDDRYRREAIAEPPAWAAATSQPSSLPQLWIRVKVVPHLPGSANSVSASRRSEASSSSLSVSSSRDSSATLN